MRAERAMAVGSGFRGNGGGDLTGPLPLFDLTATQIVAFTTTDVSHLTATTIAGLDASQLNLFSTTNLAQFDAAQVTAINASAFIGISTTNIAAFSAAGFAGLSLAQAQVLTTAQAGS